MRGARTALAALLVLSAPESQGEDRASEIFNREKRLLNPPSRSLKSNAANLDYRLQSESDRLADRMPGSDEEAAEGTQLPTSGVQPMPPVKGAGGAAPPTASGQSRVKTNTRRRDRFSARGKGLSGFDGERIFAIGFVGAGAYGIFGTEVEFAVDERINVGLGLGTGMTYSTWGAHGKYYFNSSGRLNTFFQAGYAHWYLGRAPSSASTVKPNYLAQRFFSKDGTLQSHKSVDLIYPGIGVQVQSSSGLAFSTQLQYLVSLRGFSGGLFGDLALHFYF